MELKWQRIPYYLNSTYKLLNNIPLRAWIKVLYRKQILIKIPHIYFNYVNLDDVLAIKEVVLDKVYEYGDIKIESNDKYIVDIGAGVGDFTIYTAYQHPKATIHSIEPNSEKYSILCSNLYKNGITNVVAINRSINSLEDILKYVPRIDFLKVDCEGGEFSIFNQNNIKLLKRVKKIAMEYHLKYGSVEYLVNILKKGGFTISTIPQPEVPAIGYLFSVKNERLLK